MLRAKAKYLLIAAVVAASVALWTPRADAHWGYWGWHGSSYWNVGYPCGGAWYLGVRPGPIRRALFGPYRWYYAGWGCYTPCCTTCYCSPCCCWDTCCWDVCCSDTVVTGAVYSPTPAQPTPAHGDETPEAPPSTTDEPTPPAPEPKTPSPPPPGLPGPASTRLHNTSLETYVGEPTRSDSGLLTVYVPFDAKVLINGMETKATGSRRQYVSYGLAPGYRYKYEVRAQIVRDGKLVEEVKTVYLTAGAKEGLAFGFNPQAAEGLAALP